MEWNLDFFTLAVCAANAAAAGVVVLCWDAPMKAQATAALELSNWVAVLLAVCLSWMCAFMDDWTLLFTCIAIMLWDIIAVLTPCGPLRYAMAVTKHRKLIGEALALPRGLEIEGPSYYLGSGDLVFYSVIVARAASRGTASFAAAFICVIMGFVLTVGVTAAGQDAAVPALPFSVCGGVAGMLFTWWLAQPYVDGLVQFQLSSYGASTA